MRPYLHLTMFLFGINGLSAQERFAFAQPSMLPRPINTEKPEFGGTISPDGRTFWFNRASHDRSKMILWETRLGFDRWSNPERPAFTDTTYQYIDPMISPDGNQLIFTSNRPMPNSKSSDYNLWTVRPGESNMTALPASVNTSADEIYASMNTHGDVYFARFQGNKAKLYVSVLESGAYQEAVPLKIPGTDTASVSNPAISPDGKYLVFISGQMSGFGSADLFVTKKLADGQWSYPINLGLGINSKETDFAPAFSADGTTLFFTSERRGVVYDFPADKRRPGDIYAVAFKARKYFGEQVTFKAKDNTTVSASIFYTDDRPDRNKPVILLFHMVRSNGLAEYQYIIPFLLDMGYNLMVTDHRAGSGKEHGGENRTAKALASSDKELYCEALPDVQAALDYAVQNGYSGKRILWGSGLSAALVLQVAANQRDKVAGVLAFAPAQGELVSTCEPNEALLARLKLPIAVFRAETEMSQPRREEQAQLFTKFNIPYFVVPGNQHGSSVLDAARNSSSTDPAWLYVKSFLKNL
jgi:Tol biopolymer transport system component